MTPSPVKSETLDRFVGYHMKCAFDVVREDLRITLEPFDLGMLTYSALVLIVGNPGLSQMQLATALDIKQSNVVAIVDRLEQQKRIVRNRVLNDRRARALTATQAGQHLCGQAVMAVKAHEDRLFARLDIGKRDALTTVLSSFNNRKDI